MPACGAWVGRWLPSRKAVGMRCSSGRRGRGVRSLVLPAPRLTERNCAADSVGVSLVSAESR
ncbi:hypothetical protein ACFPRL_21975 [Pseudoclavibacter helvolus]